MRAVAMLAGLLVFAPLVRADDVRLQWPLQPAAVTRAFDAPVPDWQRGHRGVDLAGRPGQPVYSAGPGTVVFAGSLAGRPVISVAHEGGLRTSYEPVEAAGLAGLRVV
ncbi:MAG: M23 family metallopeptidase, partial [Mycobacterium sp.]